MSFGQSIKHVFGNLATFQGRARRSEFWWFYLFIFLVSLPLAMLAYVPILMWTFSVADTADGSGSLTQSQVDSLMAAVFGTMALAFVLGAVTFCLMLSVWVRRLHDAGYSGHWLWFCLAGLSIVPLILAILEGQRGANQWGEDPKAVEHGQWPRLEQTSPQYAQRPYAQQPYGQQYGQVPAGGPTQAPPGYVAPLNPGPDIAPPVPDDPADPFAAPPR